MFVSFALFCFVFIEWTKLLSSNGWVSWPFKSKSWVLCCATGRNSSRQLTHLSHLKQSSVPLLLSILLFFFQNMLSPTGATLLSHGTITLNCSFPVYTSVSLIVFPVQNGERQETMTVVRAGLPLLVQSELT